MNEEGNQKSQVLEALRITLPLLSDIVGVDLQFTLCDRERVLEVWKAKTFSLPSAMSDVELTWDNQALRNILEAMNSGKSRTDLLPKELCGEPIRGIVTPVYDRGVVVGAVACASSLKEMDNIKLAAENLFNNLSQCQNAVEEIAGGAVNLADKINHINQAVEIVTNEVKKVEACVTSIQSNASRSNILALNGSIEAARVGEVGSGFAVIAQEMRKFSNVSGDTAKKITSYLKDVTDSVGIITNVVNDVNGVATQQAASTQEITATLNDITDQAYILTTFNINQ